MAGRLVDFLQPGESVILRERRDARSIIDAVLGWFILGTILVGIGLVFLDDVPTEVGPGFKWTFVTVGLLVWAVTIPISVFRVRTTRYVITEERIYKSYGRLRFNLLQTTYDKVTDTHVRQGPIGRMFGYGTVTLYTAGANLSLSGIADPFAVKVRLEEARSAFFHRLVQDHQLAQSKKTKSGREAPAAKAAARAAAHALVWSGQPTLASFLGKLLGTLMFLLPAVAFLFVGLFGSAQFLWFSLAMLAFAGFTVLSLVIQYRYSHFEVTNGGVVVTTGWLGRRRVETTYNKVTDVLTTQSLLGRLLGYGDIRVNTAGANQAPVHFSGIANPEAVKRLIDQARGVA